MESIIENNKLIAEFMGAYIENGSNERYNMLTYHNFPPAKNSNLIHTAIVCGVEDMQYHTSWDWLMPVVEKIEDIDEINVFIESNGTQIYDWRKKTDIVNNIADISFVHKIEHVYDAVVKFTKWYNLKQSLPLSEILSRSEEIELPLGTEQAQEVERRLDGQKIALNTKHLADHIVDGIISDVYHEEN